MMTTSVSLATPGVSACRSPWRSSPAQPRAAGARQRTPPTLPGGHVNRCGRPLDALPPGSTHRRALGAAPGAIKGIRHVVVLRAHTLAQAVFDALERLAAAAPVTVWPVWHHHGLPAGPATTGSTLSWADNVTLLRASAHTTDRDVVELAPVGAGAARGPGVADRPAAGDPLDPARLWAGRAHMRAR